MTDGRRIALNTIASYGRSLFGVVCGVFSTRWVLMALGQVDYGLFGLICGLVIFVSFLNIQFASAIARYYAVMVGAAKAGEEGALDECRAWFSSAVAIHTVIPLSLISVGYPIGVCAISSAWLNIPPERVQACVWLWRFVCLSSFVAMVNVPFQAMYTARQYIAELTIYSILQTTAKTLFIYYMANHPGDWLVSYGMVVAAVAIVPEIAICIRACRVFPECRFVKKAIAETWRFKRLASFAFWQAVGGVGFVASHQAMGVLINMFFGARLTGSFSVSNTVAGEAASLTGALQSSFSPAIATAYGENNMPLVRRLAFCSCKIGTLLTLAFAIPMMLEIDELLVLWLKDPPPHAAELCVCTLLFIVIEKLSVGHLSAVIACGRVALFQLVRGLLRTMVIPLALLPVCFSLGIVAVSSALPISAAVVVFGDVLLARTRVQMGALYWLRTIVLPLVFLSFVTMGMGSVPRLFMEQSFLRMVATASVSMATLVLVAWFFVLDREERCAVCRVIGKVLGRLRQGTVRNNS